MMNRVDCSGLIGDCLREFELIIPQFLGWKELKNDLTWFALIQLNGNGMLRRMVAALPESEEPNAAN